MHVRLPALLGTCSVTSHCHEDCDCTPEAWGQGEGPEELEASHFTLLGNRLNNVTSWFLLSSFQPWTLLFFSLQSWYQTPYQESPGAHPSPSGLLLHTQLDSLPMTFHTHTPQHTCHRDTQQHSRFHRHPPPFPSPLPGPVLLPVR